ncbi:dihydropteroate synthase, partial [Paenibacillus sp. O199]
MTLTPVIYERNYAWGPAELKLGTRTLIMGILNVTPDSFSDGGRYTNVERAVAHAIQMMEDGADLIDIGGESTRPGSDIVGADEELSRIIPVIEALRQQAPHIPISVDTYKADVARQ